ncbi:myo-inositol-1(or 4)-monophosphatase [Williamsia limnetica]|uniref:inositol-phosphate phosphatase n=1 Tax=Williamsia limnetica TaxID=882452 RepID=A0A318RK94_WILLI|nr:inositol monophosphatase [Williamsia limnetica]PYE15863.1 myo-inositol-1(or 4)-monophosphatase [Williamsia limnetica]
MRSTSGLPAGLDPERLLATAVDVLDSVADRFLSGVGAPSAVVKGHNDFATELDLELERIITAELSERTGVGVHGEEFGGPELSTGTVWVVDPIDGTYNYSAGLPIAGILLALVHDGQPVLGLTWLPMSGLHYAGLVGSGLTCNGKPVAPMPDLSLSEAMLAFGAFNIASRGRYPGAFRLELLGELSRRAARLRLFGSTGFDLALTASGSLGGAVSFGHHAWDNAAGAALVLAAGGQISDIEGRPWSVTSPSIIAASPGVHAELLQLIGRLGEPGNFTPPEEKYR